MIFPGALGDLLLALPALRALRTRHHGAHATAVVNAGLRDIASVAGVADATVALESAETAALFADGGTPRWLGGRPHVYSWLGADDAAVRARVAAMARSAHFFRVERGPGTTHAAVVYARAVRAAAPASMSKTLASLARGWREMFRACIWPIRPHPSTAMLSLGPPVLQY